jgi:hypothetical protein
LPNESGHRRRPRRRAARLGALALLATLMLVTERHAGAEPPSDAPAPSPTASGPRERVLRGEVVEDGCFIIGGRRGEPHRRCALSCALAGESLGILDDQTKLLFVVVQDLSAGPEQNPLLPWIAQKVEVRGVTMERGGVNGVIVRQVRPLNRPAKR